MLRALRVLVDVRKLKDPKLEAVPAFLVTYVIAGHCRERQRKREVGTHRDGPSDVH